ncbi:sensor histidine kinase [candidate division KSB1 bacterium]
MNGKIRKLIIKYSLLIFVFGVIAVLFSSESFLIAKLNNAPSGFMNIFPYELLRWMPWVIFMPFILTLSRKFLITGLRPIKVYFIHSSFAVLFSMFHASFYFIYDIFLDFSTTWNTATIMTNFVRSSTLNFFVYWVIVGVYFLLNYYRKTREAELKASQMETQLAHAKLDVLKMQLQPHFLFNTLHMIPALFQIDPEAADKMICRLADLLRISLDNSDDQTVPLRKELEFLKIFLEIQETRFKDRLRIEYDIDKTSLDCLIPNLILQPLVENSIKHGIAPRAEGGIIQIGSLVKNGRLILKITDDGDGLKEDILNKKSMGIGLSNTIARLKQIYNNDHKFQIRNASAGGTEVLIDIPYQMP